MFCTNCGKQFEGNFCPNCGVPAHPAARATSVPAAPAKKEYPAPPLGTYEGLCTVIIKKESIVFQKSKALQVPIQEVSYSDIAYVYLLRRESGKKYICLRTKDTLSFPFPEGTGDIECMKDPFTALINNKNKGAAERIYQFLKEVAEINAYEIPTPIVPPKAESRQYQSTPKERIRENQRNGIACCPKCGSTSLSAGKGGFSLGKAAIGSLVAWPVGLAAGALGSGKTVVTCLSCGHKWKP